MSNHNLPTTPPSACFIHVNVGSDPRDYLIPLVIAEKWGISQGQILTPEKATEVAKAVERYRTRQQARGRESEWRRLRVGNWPQFVLIATVFLVSLTVMVFSLIVIGRGIARWIIE